MRKRNAVRAAAAALAATMVLTACGGGGGNETTAAAGGDTGSTAAGGDAAASGSGEVGKTDITVAMGADIVTLDPAGQQDTTTAVVIKHAYSMGADESMLDGIADVTMILRGGYKKLDRQELLDIFKASLNREA